MPKHPFFRPCPICSHTTGDVLHTQRFALFDDYPLPAEYDVVACDACGMIFADTAATQADYERYYATCSIYQDPSVSGDWDIRRQTESVKRMARLLESKDARILDIGCANGGLLQRFREAGFTNLVGVDPSTVCVANARSRGVEAWQGSLSALPRDVGACDLVILNSVLEHVLDVKGAIRAMASVCCPTGKLFLQVPDAAAYADHVHAPFQDFNTEHINHFSTDALDRLMAQFELGRCHSESVIVHGVSGFEFAELEAAYEMGPGARGRGPGASELRAGIVRYIARSGELMGSLNRQIEKALGQSPKLIVWGTGQLAMKLLRETALSGARIVAFVDSNSVHRGRRIRGIPVLMPEDVNDPTVPVLIATLLHTEPVRARMRALGWASPVITLSGATASR